MRVLLQTRFFPNIGGIETLADILAQEWVRAGVEVAVSTDIPAAAGHQKTFPFPVYHVPSSATRVRLVRQADIVVHMNVSLKAFWPLVFSRAQFVAIHQGCYYLSRDKRRDWKERLKLRLARHAAANIACSRYVAQAIGIECDVVPNAYNDRLFTAGRTASTRLPQLAFVGRLVDDKGADLLLTALRLLRPALSPRLTIIGDGPERRPLERKARDLGLGEQVAFAGAREQADVARLLREHQVLVIPSLWEEPFGIVALEGAGSGCVVLGSDTGGLPEAIGPAGVTFRAGSAEQLALKLQGLLQDPARTAALRAAAPAHLQKHRPAFVANQYLQVFRRLLQQ